MRNLASIAALIFSFGCTTTPKAPVTPPTLTAASAKEFITNFYRDYLLFDYRNGARSRGLKFSRSFQSAIDDLDKLCAKNAGSDICGFGANGDIYLNAQEYDTKLTLEQTNFRASELNVGVVDVSLNVYPKYNDKFYDRKIRYFMIRENDQWVVDDIQYPEAGGAVSTAATGARAQIADEMKEFATPNPAVKEAQKK